MKPSISMSPTAKLQFRIREKGIRIPDVLFAGGFMVEHTLAEGVEQSIQFDWSNFDVFFHHDKNNHLIVTFHMRDFDQEFFSDNQPLVMPDWALLTQMKLKEVFFQIGYSDSQGKADELLSYSDVDLLAFDIQIMRKRRNYNVLTYGFSDDQLTTYMKMEREQYGRIACN